MIKTFSLLLAITFITSIHGQKVMVIGIDGMRSDVYESANTPNLDLIRSNGIYSPDALNDDITISGPGWSAIVCGVLSDKHLVTGNNFSGNNYDEYPSIFSYIEDYNADLSTISIVHWSPINTEIIQDADVTINVTSDLAVSNEAILALTTMDPDLLFLHFDDIDGAGHSTGFSESSSVYTSTIEATDNHIGFVMDALQNRPNYLDEDWIILVTSDHGGLGTSHGGNSIEEKNVVFMASGNSIANTIITKTVETITIDNCLDETIELYFDGDNDFVKVENDGLFDFGENQDFTIECRVRTDQAADVSIIGNKDWNSGSNKGFVFSFRFASGPEWKLNIGDGSNRTDINVGGAIANNEWHTLSATFDRDGMLRMYENGVFIAEEDMSGIGNITNGNNLFFGADVNQAFDYTGGIAEVRIWETILSANEIENYHCSPLDDQHPSYSSLIGYWKMNENQGSTVFDSSVEGNDGTISNAQWQTTSSIDIFDYSATPRIEDIAVTALAHLCIPIDTSWSLDGKSWVNDCEYGIPECANPGINSWIGPTDGIWHDDAQWSQNRIPIICDHVVIPDGITVEIIGENNAICRSLKTLGSGLLKIGTGSNLEISED